MFGSLFISFSKLGVPTIMENQMEKKMENEMETGFLWGIIGIRVSRIASYVMSNVGPFLIPKPLRG